MTNDLKKRKNNDAYSILAENKKILEEEQIPAFLKIDIKIFFRTIKKRLPYIILASLLCTIIALFVIKQSWTAKSVLIKHVANPNMKLDVPLVSTLEDLTSIIELVNSRDSRQEVINRLNLKITERQLRNTLKFTTKVDSNLIKIQAKSQDRHLSAQIANTMAEVFIDYYIKYKNLQSKKLLDYYKNRQDEEKLLKLKEELQKARKKYTEKNLVIQQLKEEIRFIEEKLKKTNKYSAFGDGNYELNEEELKEAAKEQNESYLPETSVNDLKILERAVPANSPSPSKRSIAIAGAFFGFFFSLLLILLFEFFDFSVKSQYDFTNVFGINMIAKLPAVGEEQKDIFVKLFNLIKKRFNKKNNKESDNSLLKQKDMQLLYSNLHLIIDRIHQEKEQKTKIITIASDTKKTGKTFLALKIIKLLVSEKKKILYITSKKNIEPKMKNFVINDYLYEKNDSKLNSFETKENFFRNIFCINSDIYTKILTKDKIKSFLETLSSFDYVIWEIFDPKVNMQLFSNIILSSNFLMIVAKFKKSKRAKINEIIQFLKEKKYNNVVGVLNYVEKTYY